MKVDILINNKPLELTPNVNFQLSATSSDPLKGGQASRKYTSSINVPRTAVNDAILGGWRFPLIIERKSLAVALLIDGVTIDYFSGHVSSSEKGYTLTLVQQSKFKETNEAIVTDNSADGVYNERANGVSDVVKLLKGEVARLGYSISIEGEKPLFIENKVSKASAGEVASNSLEGQGSYTEYFVYEYEPLRLLLECVDKDRRLTFVGNKYGISIDARDIIVGDRRVTLHVGRDDITLSSAGNDEYDQFFTIPNTYFNLTKGQKVDICVRVNGVIVPAFFGHMGVEVTDTITYKYESGIKSVYDLLKAYSEVNFYSFKIDEVTKRITVSNLISEDSINYSDKVQDITSIGDSGSAAKTLNVKIGDFEFTSPFDANAFVNLSEGVSSSVPNKWEAPSIGKMKNGRVDRYFLTEQYAEEWATYYGNFTSLEVETVAILDIWDVLNFDQSTKIYVEQLHLFGYVTEISAYNIATKKAKVKFIIINDKALWRMK